MEVMTAKDILLEKANRLKPIEKLQLIDALLESLDKPDKEIEKQWIKEADGRYEAFKRGDLKSSDCEEIKKRYE